MKSSLTVGDPRPWPRRARIQVGLTLVLLAVCPSMSRAAAPLAAPDGPIAQALFEAGRRLMDEGRFTEACPKLAESHRLDPAAGTLLNLAVCHEKEGKTASAWAEYNDLLGMKSGEGDAERRRIASDRLAQIEPGLARVVIIPDSVDLGLDLRITLDGVQIRRAAVGVPLPVDPGVHHVAINAAGRREWSAEVAPTEPGAVREVRAPRLELAILSPSVAATNAAPAPAVAPAGGARRAVAYGAAAGAVILLSATGYLGYLAKAEWDRRNEHCAPDCDNPIASDAGTRARNLARGADFTFGAGIISGAIGVYCLVTSSRAPVSPTPAATVGMTGQAVTFSYGGKF